MSDKKKKSSHEKPHEMHIKRAHGGGYIVTHHPKKKHSDMLGGGEPTDHVVPDAEQLQAHVQDNLGDQPPAGSGPVADPDAEASMPQAQVAPQGM